MADGGERKTYCKATDTSNAADIQYNNCHRDRFESGFNQRNNIFSRWVIHIYEKNKYFQYR